MGARFPVYGGYSSFRFTAEHASVTLHAHNGDELYTARPIPRRDLRMLPLQAPLEQPDSFWIVIPVVVACVLSLIWPFSQLDMKKRSLQNGLGDALLRT